jgi:SAM-dependent methyltransferase
MIASPKVDPPATVRWRSLLERIIPCPRCGGSIDLEPVPCCPCGWRGSATGGIPDFVDERALQEEHLAEMAAQSHAVENYYENERKLCCHWDRISSSEIPSMLGLDEARGAVALDLGCGTGTAGNGLRKAGVQVVGADLSRPCLEVAARRLDAVVRADAASLPFASGSFDAIVSRGALHHLADPHAALAEAHRVSKRGARAIFMDPREWFWLEPIKRILRREDHSFTHDHHAFRPEEYARLIGHHFWIERSYTVHPFGILVANGADVLPMPSRVPARMIARGLYELDRLLDRTPLDRVGHLLVVVARKE